MSCVFKLGYNGTNWIDKVASKTVYLAGSPAITVGTGVKGAAAYAPITAQSDAGYLYLADSLDFSFGSGDFTINCWFKGLAAAGAQLFSYGTEGDIYFDAWFTHQLYSYFTLYIYDYAGGANKFCKVRWTTDDNDQLHLIHDYSWNHIEVSRSSGSFIFFVNGVLVSSPYVAYSGYSAGFAIPEIAASFHIGTRINWHGNSIYTAGQLIEDFAIYKGECLHTIGFNPSYPGLLPGFQVL